MFFNKCGAFYMIICLRAKKSRTKNLNFSKLKLSSRRKKDLGPFSLLSPTTTDIGYSFVRLHKVSWRLWCKLYDFFFGT